MLNHFYWKKFHDKILITNDAGFYDVLLPEEFELFIRDKTDPNSETWKRLESKLFCYNCNIEEYVRRAEYDIREYNKYLFEPTSLYIIALTNQCNNRCVYCQANGMAHPSVITREVIDQIMIRIRETPGKYITIEFQGGEPLTCYDKVKYAVLKAEETLNEKTISFSIVSNLILLTEEMAAFFKEHHVSVSTSLDGPRILQEKNRPGTKGISSYESVIEGKEILDKYGVMGGAIQTTTAYSLPYAKEIVRTYAELGFSQIFIRPLTRLGAAARSWDSIGYMPEQYLKFYREAFEEIIKINIEGIRFSDYYISLLLSKIIYGKSPNYMELRSPCGAALGQLAFTANGNVYTCDEGRMMAEMGDQAFKLGNVFEDGYNEWMNTPCCKAVCSASLLDSLPGCHDCVYKPYCGVCPVVNYALNGNILSVSKDRCAIQRGIFDMLFEYIENGTDSVVSLMKEWGGLLYEKD